MNKQARYLLSAIVESSQDSIVSIDLNRQITSWNKGAEELYGYKASEAIGQSLDMVMLPNDVKGLIDKVNDIVTEMVVPIYETVRIHKNGKHAELEILLSPVRDTSGTVIGISTVARDISVRKMQERQKDDFIAVASHELKSPVTSIKSYSELLLERLEEVGDGTITALAQKLDRQLDRLIELLKNLLDTTKLAAGEMLLHKEVFNMNALIEEHIDLIQFASGHHGIEFRSGNTGEISADKKLIGQVITNLISNAVKYSPEGGKVIVTTREAGNGIEVSVQDFGIGMPEEVKDKIFERYFRASNAFTETSPGMGLGLYISAGIIHQHGGKITVESSDGKGSTFSFTLPYGK